MSNNGLSPESLEAITDEEFARAIKYVAMDLGADATLADVKRQIEAYKPLPKREIRGKVYTAGYKGVDMVPKGTKHLCLVNIEEKGKTIKFMFTTPDRRFVYYTVPKEEISISEIIERSSQIGASFPVHVHHEVIEHTGEYHATVSAVEWGKRNENFIPISQEELLRSGNTTSANGS